MLVKAGDVVGDEALVFGMDSVVFSLEIGTRELKPTGIETHRMTVMGNAELTVGSDHANPNRLTLAIRVVGNRTYKKRRLKTKQSPASSFAD